MKTDAATYVIVFDYNGDRRFWSGLRWVAEYPEAEVYTDEQAARRAFCRVEVKARLRANEACLVRGYGDEDETPIRWSQP